MLFDWSAECNEDDPVLVVPWGDQTGLNAGTRFVDLRQDPYATEEIPEAELYPAMLHALRSLNAPRSPVFTAKCDVWTPNQAEREHLRLELDTSVELAFTGLISYVDLLWRDRAIFTSFHQHEHLVDRLARRAESLDHPLAGLDCIVRPALLDLTGPQQGFALTLYVKALGVDDSSALAAWSSALTAAVGLLRSRDLTPST